PECPTTPPALNEIPEGCRQDEQTALSCLAHLGSQSDDATLAVDVPPFETENLPSSPSCEVSEVEDVLMIRRKVFPQRHVFSALHEPLSRLPFRKAGYVGTSAKPSRLEGEREESAQNAQIPVHRSRCRSFGDALPRVLTHHPSGDVDRPHVG